jgi:hypothetical protein
MEGYRDNEVYYCGDWCDESSVDAVKARLAVTSSSSQQQELLNIICNMGEYKRVSAGAYAVDTIAFEVKVQLSEAEIKKTYVASAKRNDWHVATLNDIFGKCKEDKMKSQSSLSVYDGTNYKCDNIESNGGSYYTWREASELDANATLGICTYARDKEVVKVNDMYYECEAHEVNSSTSRDWSEYSESGYLNKNLGECNTSSQTQSIDNLVYFESNYYKCDCIDETCIWSSANDDERLGKLCSHNNSEEEFESDEDNQSYVCSLDGASSSYSWSAP